MGFSVAAESAFCGMAALEASVALVLLVLDEGAMASLALAATEGAVRTTVPVSLRGTAFSMASLAAGGWTPTVPGVVLAAVCAKTAIAAAESTMPREAFLHIGFIQNLLKFRGK